MNSSRYRTQHVGVSLDAQGEQMNEDDDDELCTPAFSARHPGTSAEGNEFVSRGVLPTIIVLQPIEVKESIRTLHVEQRLVFDVVLNFLINFSAVEIPRLRSLLFKEKQEAVKRS